MDRSMMAMIYLITLLALFLILIIATIAVIVSKSKRYDDDDDDASDADETYDDADTDTEQTADDNTIFHDTEDMIPDDFYVDNLEDGNQSDSSEEYDDDDAEYDEEDSDFDFMEPGDIPIVLDPDHPNAPTQELDTDKVKQEKKKTIDSAFADVLSEEELMLTDDMKPVADTVVNVEQDVEAASQVRDGEAETDEINDNTGMGDDLDADSEKVSWEEYADSSDALEEDTDSQDTVDEEDTDSQDTVDEEYSDLQDALDEEYFEEQLSGPEPEEPAKETKKQKKKHKRKKQLATEDSLTGASVNPLSDSAFAPELPDASLSNEALAASVREAEAMGAAIMGGLKAAQVSAETMFGINEQLSSYGSKKNKRAKSNVSSDEEFYWYNKEDVASRPARRPAEVYYHYFNIAGDCIEDLLVEMYDCAVVRTEEIRYIAYGIEPKTFSMKEIMSGANLADHKQKEPTTQDLVRIYEKWCTYVERLFDIVEIHADEYTIQEIRKQLCEYGRNDVDVLLEGK